MNQRRINSPYWLTVKRVSNAHGTASGEADVLTKEEHYLPEKEGDFQRITKKDARNGGNKKHNLRLKLY